MTEQTLPIGPVEPTGPAAGQRFTILRPIPGPAPAGEDLDAHVQAAQAQWHEDLAATGWRPVGDPTFTVEPAYSFDHNMTMTWIRVTGRTDRPEDDPPTDDQEQP